MSLTVRILQHEFPINRAYGPGHILTAAEATALNQLLVENVRNNVYTWVVREARGRGVLTAQQQADLTSRISEYADNYVFKTKSKLKRHNPLEVAIRELARQEAEVWGNRMGYGPDSREVIDKYAELRGDTTIQDSARALVLKRQDIVNDALVGIL